MTLIKICGLTDEASIVASLHAGAEYIGLNFFPKSPRHLEMAKARKLAESVRNKQKIVAVTVDADDSLLDKILKEVQPDFIQAHGHEPPDRVAFIQSHFNCPVIKALPISKSADLHAVDLYKDADALLFDAKPPDDADLPGGLGVPFDWSVLHTFKTHKFWFLSGGLNAENVNEALTITQAPGVDISSGVEKAPGVKDPQRITEFVTHVRQNLIYKRYEPVTQD